MSVNILALESSCDETSAAILSDGVMRSHSILSQDVHEIYGGVVPELASRAHQKHIIAIVEKVFRDAAMSPSDINALGFTRGPGLLGSLLVGVSFAKGFALALDLPFIAINHMQAHILAHFLEDPKPSFPFLCLTVSGGHTQIVKVSGYLAMEVIGETRDDAVGEAFDKTAKMLGFPYPGGHLIDQHALRGDPYRFSFAKAVIPGLDFSFSGIKTSVLYFLRKETKKDPEFIRNNLDDLCAGIQQVLIEMLMEKLESASDKTGLKEIAIAGGVAANSGLRKALNYKEGKAGWRTYIPDLEFCTDNAAMIGIAAHYKYLAGEFSALTVSPDARMKI